MEKSSKGGHEKKSLVSISECFLTAIAKDEFLQERRALGYVSSQM